LRLLWYGGYVVPTGNNLLSDSAFIALRFVLSIIILSVLFLTIRRAILVFAGERSKRLGRKKYVLMAGNALVFAFAFLLRMPFSRMLEKLGGRIGRVVPIITDVWFGTTLVAIFYTIVSLLFLLFVIQIVGAVFWFFDARLAARDAVKRPIFGVGGAASIYVLKTLSYVNRVSRATVLTILIAAFFIEIFHFFKGTQPIVEGFMISLGTPGRNILQAILNYLPKLGYLVVIGFLGWILLRILRHAFNSVRDGTLNIPGFQPEWASPTYKLLRFVVLLFLLMVSFPYLPGAGSQFFQGFSVFVGALVTFGSSGAISNIMSGITLTYTNAFRPGDFVRIGDSIGFVRERSLLVTRIVTIQNEAVTIPNGSILSTSILNYTYLAASKGLVLTVSAGIGYDVDWRTVRRLMIEGARRTEHILSDPSPCVWQTELGDYAVSYQLRAWSDRADLMYETHSNLRANVLDEFNRAGVEIMTPSIFAHRDASNLAIPHEQFPNRPEPRGIAVNVKTHESNDTVQRIKNATD
jgi:small-conductance mechanosensitive channel